MKRFSLLLLLTTFVSIAGFTQTSDIKEGCVPLEVKFTAPASASSYYWDFKDGVTSDKPNPTNIFNKAGIYDVAFRESPGGPLIGTVQIKVYKDPILNVKVAQGCLPLNAKFEDASQIDPAIAVTNYTWVFGDGQSQQSTSSTTTHLYSSLGKFDISYKIDTKFPTCNKTVIFNSAVEVIPPPVVSFTTNPASTVSCKDTLMVSFTSTSTGTKPLTYLWNFGNGKTSVVQNPPQQRYISGQYSASLTVSYANLTGCTVSTYQGISTGKPKAVLTAKKDTVCLGTPAVIRTTTPGSYSWSLGPNATAADLNNDGIPDLNKDSIMVSFSKSGSHTISLTVTANGQCSDTKSIKIYVDEVTAKIQSSDPTFTCESPRTVNLTATSNQSNVSYEWPDISNAKTQNVKKTFLSKSDTVYYDKNFLETFYTSVTVTSNKTGCKATASRLDSMWLPNALFMPDKVNGCGPLTIKLSDSSTTFDPIVSWTWIYGDGTVQTNSNKNAVSHTYINPGEYPAKLAVTTKKGCRDTSYAVMIEVGKDLASQVDFTADKTEVCPGEPVKLSVTNPLAIIDAYHFTSEANRVFHCSNEKEVTWTYDYETGPQAVSLTLDYNGCFTTIPKPGLVKVKGAIAKIDYSSLCSSPLVYTFNDKSKNATLLSWNFGDGMTGTATKEIHTYAKTGDYEVTLTASDPSSGCAATTDRAKINVRQIKAKLKIDPLMCIKSPYALDASGSTDVYASCHTGYTFQFPTMDKRPYTTDKASPSFIFEEAGKHKVRLIVKDINGCRDTATVPFKIFDMTVKPTADKTLICNPSTVQFTDKTNADTTILSWTWNLGDNTIASVPNPKHTYTSGGNGLQVSLTIKDALGCQETEYLPIAQYTPFTFINASDYTLCLGDSVTISAPDFTAGGSHLTYAWDFGNGKTGTSNSHKLLYKAAQNYIVTLNYKETGTGCSGTTGATISVQDYPVAGFKTNVDTLSVLCAPQNVFFADTSRGAQPLTQYWNFGNGQTSQNTSFSLFYPKGNFEATHIVQTSFGCADTIKKSFKVYRPLGDFDIDKNTICKGEEIKFTLKDTSDVGSYTWAFGDGNTLNNTAPVTHKYNFHPPSGQTFARLVVRGFDGICPIERQKQVNIIRVIADFTRENGTDTTICFNDGPYHLTNNSVNFDKFLWNLGDGQTSTELNPVHQYATPGTYDVMLSVASSQFSCKDTITKEVVIYPNPKMRVMGDTVCAGSKLHPMVTNPVVSSTYQWLPATGLSDPSSAAPEATLAHTIIYDVIETDTNGCTDKQKIPAIVIEPIGLQDWDTSIVIGDKIALPVYGPPVYIFKWTPDNGLSCLDCNYPLVQPLKDITYQLDVTDVRGCFASSNYFKVEVKPETFVKLPTSFTPNGDGSNDVIYLRGWGIKELLEFQIFNRWGQMIYSSTDIHEGWDGKYKGTLQNSDVYVYRVKVRTWREEEIFDEGYINLIH